MMEVPITLGAYIDLQINRLFRYDRDLRQKLKEIEFIMGSEVKRNTLQKRIRTPPNIYDGAFLENS